MTTDLTINGFLHLAVCYMFKNLTLNINGKKKNKGPSNFFKEMTLIPKMNYHLV